MIRKPKCEMTPQELIEEEAEMEDWTADLLTIAAGEEAMAKARAQQSDLSPPGGNVPSPEIPQSLFKSLEHL